MIQISQRGWKDIFLEKCWVFQIFFRKFGSQMMCHLSMWSIVLVNRGVRWWDGEVTHYLRTKFWKKILGKPSISLFFNPFFSFCFFLFFWYFFNLRGIIIISSVFRYEFDGYARFQLWNNDQRESFLEPLNTPMRILRHNKQRILEGKQTNLLLFYSQKDNTITHLNDG